MESAISCQNITKKFGDHTVLKNLSIEIPKGKITTILGYSGAGKSTLMKHFLGLQKPTKGKLFVLDKNVSELSDDELRNFRKQFGMLFQYAALFDSLSTYDNIAFPLKEFTKLPEAQIKEKVINLMSSVGLDEQSLDRLPAELSGGMRKRVGLARALALEPDILLYDEPTTGLDPITTKMVNDLIITTGRTENTKGLTSVIISHDIQATLKISDYIAFLERGEIIEFSPTKEFKNTKHKTIRMFLDLTTH